MARGRRGRQRGLRPADVAIAESEAKVRYGPERSTLAALIGEVEGQYKSDVQAARSGARSAVIAANRARKPLRQISRTALGQADAAQQDVEQAFGQLGASADVFRAATAREQGTEAQRAASAHAQAMRDVQSRKLEAQTGRQFAVGQARSTRGSELSKLAQRLRDLGDEEGAFIVGRLGSLREARAGRAVQRRGQDITAATQRRGQNITRRGQDITAATQRRGQDISAAGGGGGVGGNKPATRAELKGFQTNFAKALAAANRMPVDRPTAASRLLRGAGKNVPSIGDQLAVGIALDMAYDGHVSRNNAAELHERGIRVADVPGAVPYTTWIKRKRGTARPQDVARWGVNYAVGAR